MKGKQITQETFDATVKENIDEFEMSWDDALADAILQFKALGVDLESIVTTKPSTAHQTDQQSRDGAPSNVEHVEPGAASTSSEQTYPAIKAQSLVEELTRALEDVESPTGRILKLLAEVTTACDDGLAQRCLLANYGATPVLFEACEHPSPEVCSLAFRALVTLTNGQPDVLTTANMTYVMEKCRASINDDEIESLGVLLRLIRNGCAKHEANRQHFVDSGLIPLLLDVMSKQRTVADLVQLSAATLKSLTLDDDVRVPFGRAHQHAKMIVADHGGLKILLEVATTYVDDKSTLTKVLSTLSSVAVRNEFCQAIVDDGGLPLVLNAMMENVATQAIIKVGLQLLKTIAGNDGVKNEIVKSGGVGVVLTAISTHQMDVGVCQAGCACLAALALRSPDNCRVIIDAGGANNIVASMKVHRGDVVTLKSAYRAVTNLVNRTKDYIPVFVDLGVESLINDAKRTHGSQLQSDANALLFLLGCKAEMKELWTGEKGQIDQ